jgi:phage-related protein
MGQEKYEIEFYETSNGRCPTADFLDSLSGQEYARIDRAFTRLKKHGRKLQRPHVGYLRDKIWELRVDVPRATCRLLYFFYDGNKFIITHGFKKKAQKVPDSEIDKAIEYRDNYLARQIRK